MVVEMMRTIRRRSAMFAAAAVLACGLSANAALLTPGNALFPAPGEPDPVGGTLVANQTIPFNVPGFFDGSLTSTVVRGVGSAENTPPSRSTSVSRTCSEMAITIRLRRAEL